MAGKSVYLDTSGVLGVLDADDACHDQAVVVWGDLMEKRVRLVMTDYVRLESWSLIQRRLGLKAVSDFYRSILPICEMHPVEGLGFEILARQVLLSNRRYLSIVDLSSFECMRRSGIEHAFAFDKHFSEQGFVTPGDPGWGYNM